MTEDSRITGGPLQPARAEVVPYYRNSNGFEILGSGKSPGEGNGNLIQFLVQMKTKISHIIKGRIE